MRVAQHYVILSIPCNISPKYPPKYFILEHPNPLFLSQGERNLLQKLNRRICWGDFYQFIGHRCALGVTPLLLTQRARLRSPVGPISWLRFFPGFPSTVRRMSGNLGHIRPRLSYGHHISSKLCINRLRTATVSDLSCSTWPSFNNKHQQS